MCVCVCVCVCVVYPLFRADANQFAFFGSESCGCLQDEQNGGISDRPEDMVDAFHTFFGIAALSLMGYKGLEPIDPVYALPVKVMQRIRRHQEQ